MVSSDNVFDFHLDLLGDIAQPEYYLWDHELYFVLNGTLRITVDSEVHLLPQDGVLLVNANRRCAVKSGKNTLAVRLTVPRELLKYYLRQQKPVFWCDSVLDSRGDYDRLRSILRQLLDARFQHPDSPSLMATGCYYELVELLAREFVASHREEGGGAEEQNADRISEITEYIEEHHAQHISLNNLADHLHLTYSYLSRYLKKTMGVNFLDYLNQVRLRHAVGDLLHTSKSITQIALDNGFGTSSKLNTAFREAYGKTPSEYQESMRSGAAASQSAVTSQEALRCRVRRYLAEHGADGNGVDRWRRELIRVDGTHSEPFDRHWEQLVNLGRASDLLKTRTQSQALQLRDQLGFRYVRIWGLFDEDMELGLGHSVEYLNFFKLDEALDFLTQNDLIPFIELGNKPTLIIRDLHDFLATQESYPLFHCMSELRMAYGQFFSHIVARYGAERVRTWRFDLWEDVRINPEAGYPNYFEVFNTACEVARAVLPDAVIGGTGVVIDHPKVRSLIRQWMEQPYQPDFLSVQCYPYEKEPNQKNPASFLNQSKDSLFLVHRLEEVQKHMRAAGMDCPLYVTEWNITLSDRNYINDTCYKACYLLKNIIGSLGSVSMLGYWAGLDLMHNYFDSANVVYGCSGLMTNDAICKPSFYAYRFLHRMSPNLVAAGENYLITTPRPFHYDIICFNSCPLAAEYYRVPESKHTPQSLQRYLSGIAPAHLRFQLDRLPAAHFTIKTSVVGPQYGSVLDEWLRLNTMRNLSREDIDYLKRICTPHMMIQTRDSADGTLAFDVDLAAQEFALIQISQG